MKAGGDYPIPKMEVEKREVQYMIHPHPVDMTKPSSLDTLDTPGVIAIKPNKEVPPLSPDEL